MLGFVVGGRVAPFEAREARGLLVEWRFVVDRLEPVGGKLGVGFGVADLHLRAHALEVDAFLDEQGRADFAEVFAPVVASVDDDGREYFAEGHRGELRRVGDDAYHFEVVVVQKEVRADGFFAVEEATGCSLAHHGHASAGRNFFGCVVAPGEERIFVDAPEGVVGAANKGRKGFAGGAFGVVACEVFAHVADIFDAFEAVIELAGATVGESGRRIVVVVKPGHVEKASVEHAVAVDFRGEGDKVDLTHHHHRHYQEYRQRRADDCHPRYYGLGAHVIYDLS